jgi:hypothetical protein
MDREGRKGKVMRMNWLTRFWQEHTGWKVRAIVAEKEVKRLEMKLEGLEEIVDVKREEYVGLMRMWLDFQAVQIGGRSVFGMEQERVRLKEVKGKGGSGGISTQPGEDWVNLPGKGKRRQSTRVEELVGEFTKRQGKAEVEWGEDRKRAEEKVEVEEEVEVEVEVEVAQGEKVED